MTRPHPDAGPAAESPVLPMLVYGAVLAVAVVAVLIAGGNHGATLGLPEGEQIAAGAGDVPAEEDAPAPMGVRVPALERDLELHPLGLDEGGALEVPEDPHVAGWWSGGARPGERGPAVVVAHVDSHEGPGAFHGLADLAAGERVSIDREDGTGVHFRVDRVERHPKDDFPTTAVYGDTDAPTLRLVTCAGAFDAQARSYEDNVVVFLELEGWSEAT